MILINISLCANFHCEIFSFWLQHFFQFFPVSYLCSMPLFLPFFDSPFFFRFLSVASCIALSFNLFRQFYIHPHLIYSAHSLCSFFLVWYFCCFLLVFVHFAGVRLQSCAVNAREHFNINAATHILVCFVSFFVICNLCLMEFYATKTLTPSIRTVSHHRIQQIGKKMCITNEEKANKIME